jgi:hypothetical protein
MTNQLLYPLKAFLTANYPKATPVEILAALSVVVEIPDQLTATEIAIFFAQYPKAKLRLMRFVKDLPPEGSPLEEVWVVADMALGLITLPNIESVDADLAVTAINGLRSADLLTNEEKTALDLLCRCSTTVGAQTLGYVPTLEQIEQALSLD